MYRVLNGSKGSFLRSFTLFSIPFCIGTYILDFFQVVSIPFLPFLPRRLWTGWGLNRSRLYPNAILCLHYSVWTITFLGLGLWAPTNKWSWPKILLGPTNMFRKKVSILFIFFYYIKRGERLELFFMSLSCEEKKLTQCISYLLYLYYYISCIYGCLKI